jgi:predicted MFS family arabinose efflux permease
MAGALTGNLLGATFSGVLGDLVGWRSVLIVLGSFILLAWLAVAWGFRGQMGRRQHTMEFATVLANYRRILTHPHARLCYLGVLAEGSCIMGLYPYVAAFLQQLGEPRLSIAGLVISGYAVGGLIYAGVIKRLLPLFGDNGLMVVGAIFIASQIVIISFGPPWQLQFFNFMLMGFGFYMLHGGFQVFTSEIAPDARASAVSLQAFMFNCGQFAGPLLYGVGLLSIGKQPTLFTAAAILLAVGLLCSQLLRQKELQVVDMAEES